MFMLMVLFLLLMTPVFIWCFTNSSPRVKGLLAGLLMMLVEILKGCCLILVSYYAGIIFSSVWHHLVWGWGFYQHLGLNYLVIWVAAPEWTKLILSLTIYWPF